MDELLLHMTQYAELKEEFFEWLKIDSTKNSQTVFVASLSFIVPEIFHLF